MTTPSSPSAGDPAPADRDWFGGRRWTGIAAVGVLIVVLISALVILTSHKGNSTGGDPARASTGPRVPSTSAAPTSAPLPTTPPIAAPAGTVWTIYETIALPALPGAGPAHVDGAIATGYAHSPLGALLADANESFRYLLAPDRSWRQAASAMLAAGAGTDAWLKVRSTHPYGAAGAAGGDNLSQIAGYQFVSYTPTDAVIQLVTRDSSGNLQAGTDHVSWDGSDWRFVPGPDGGQSANVQQVSSLAGFVEWKGV